jgi:hypothetical protein
MFLGPISIAGLVRWSHLLIVLMSMAEVLFESCQVMHNLFWLLVIWPRFVELLMTWS